jgi:hypothetical protein
MGDPAAVLRYWLALGAWRLASSGTTQPCGNGKGTTGPQRAAAGPLPGYREPCS